MGNVRGTIRIVLAVIGAVSGICGCVVFAGKYHNISASVWSGISAAFALFFLHIKFSVRRDLQFTISPIRFVVFMVISGIGMVAGLTVFIAYLVVGATGKEDVDGRGNYVVVVWGFMTFKWSLFSFLAARSYHKKYQLSSGRVLINN